MKNLYESLGLQENANETEIKKAYRSLSLKYHPDRNSGEEATSKFQEISAAYEILSDPQKKQQYDMGMGTEDIPQGFPFPPETFPFGGAFPFPFPGHMGRGGGGIHFTHIGGRGGGGGGGGGGPHNIHNLFETIFADMAGMGGGPSGGIPHARMFRTSHPQPHPMSSQSSSTPTPPQKPATIEKTIELTLEQVYHGDTLSLVLERVNHLTKQQESQHVQIPIPPGIDHGESILLEGAGNRGVGNQIGDVKLNVVLLSHDVFTRKDLDLFCKKTISLKEALCGFTCELTHLNGKTLRVNNLAKKEIIQPGSVREFQNYGMKKEDQVGKLFIQFDIQFPESLTEEQLTQLESLL